MYYVTNIDIYAELNSRTYTSQQIIILKKMPLEEDKVEQVLPLEMGTFILILYQS